MDPGQFIEGIPLACHFVTWFRRFRIGQGLGIDEDERSVRSVGQEGTTSCRLGGKEGGRRKEEGSTLGAVLSWPVDCTFRRLPGRCDIVETLENGTEEFHEGLDAEGSQTVAPNYRGIN